MSSMTQTAISERSFTESELCTLDESIDSTSLRLKTALADVVTLRKQLRQFLVMKKEAAIEQINKAKQHLVFVEKQESELDAILRENQVEVSSVIISPEEADARSSPGFRFATADRRREEGIDSHTINVETAQGSSGDQEDRDSAQPDIQSEISYPRYEAEKAFPPTRLLDNEELIDRIDSVTLNRAISYYQEQVGRLQEELRPREEARGLDMQAIAREKLAGLRVEREKIIRRGEEISLLEDHTELQYQQGLRLASLHGLGAQPTQNSRFASLRWEIIPPTSSASRASLEYVSHSPAPSLRGPLDERAFSPTPAQRRTFPVSQIVPSKPITWNHNDYCC